MGNIIGLIVIGVAIGFSLFVIYKLIKAGIDDRKADDKEQKEYLDNHSEDIPYPTPEKPKKPIGDKNYEK